MKRFAKRTASNLATVWAYSQLKDINRDRPSVLAQLLTVIFVLLGFIAVFCYLIGVFSPEFRAITHLPGGFVTQKNGGDFFFVPDFLVAGFIIVGLLGLLFRNVPGLLTVLAVLVAWIYAAFYVGGLLLIILILVGLWGIDQEKKEEAAAKAKIIKSNSETPKNRD